MRSRLRPSLSACRVMWDRLQPASRLQPALRRPARTRGFTLLEMIVATTLMGIAVAGMLSGLAGATRNAIRLREHEHAAQLARLRINELLVDQRLPRNVVLTGIFDPSQTGGLEAGWQAQVTNFEMPPNPAPGQTALDRIELQVWWNSGTDRRTFSLDAFRPRVLRPEDILPVPGGTQ
jgi:general secretion pathway protein I